jgi:hypothetical protein
LTEGRDDLLGDRLDVDVEDARRELRWGQVPFRPGS